MMNRRAYLKFTVAFLVWALAAPAALICFNFQRDPNHRYRRIVADEDLRRLASLEGHVLTVPANYDDRSLLAKYAEYAPRPALVLFGGSRILNITSAMLKDRFRGAFLNAGVTTGTSKDYAALWQLLKEKGKTPKTAILCLDLQALQSSSQNDLWLPLSPYYESFYERRDSLGNRLAFILSQAKDLTSYRTTALSLAALRSARSEYKVVPFGEYDSKEPARTSSFAFLYPVSYENRDPLEVEKAGRSNGEGEAKDLRHWSENDRAGFERLSALLRDMKVSGTQPALVLMPYHPLAMQRILEDGVASKNLERFRAALSGLAREHEIPYFDGCGDSLGLLRNQDFSDGVHLKAASNHAFFKRADERLKLGIFD